MAILPNKSLMLWDGFAPVFTRPTLQRFLVLMGTAILITGRHTVANLFRIAGSLARGHISSYRRVFSKASRSPLRLACALARSLLTLLPDDARSSWLATTRSSPIRESTSTARLDIAIRSARLTPSRPGDTATSGLYSPCSSVSSSPTVLGRG